MITAKQLAAIRQVGEAFMVSTVVITHRAPFALDDDDPGGDDTVRYESQVTRTTGWIVPHLDRGLALDVQQVVAVGDFDLRVPVGTRIDPGDRVTIDGIAYTVMDSGTEQTWQEWSIATVRKLQ